MLLKRRQWWSIIPSKLEKLKDTKTTGNEGLSPQDIQVRSADSPGVDVSSS